MLRIFRRRLARPGATWLAPIVALGVASGAQADADESADAAGAETLLTKVRLGERDYSWQPEEDPDGVDVPDEVDPGPTSFWTGWETSASLGLNGSSGNTERISFRGTLETVRETERLKTFGGLLYSAGSEEGETTENYFRADLRNDWLFTNSRWRWFAKVSLEFDQLQDWNWRLSGFAGPGYEFIKNDRTELVGRAGLGITQDFGGVNEETRYEGLIGFDFTHQISDRQKIFVTGEYIPRLDDFPGYRLYGKAGWEVLVDPEVNLSLQVGVEDRYDSMPGPDTRRNDLDYYLLLTWTF